MLIAHISDTHILASQSGHVSADLRADCLRRCVEDINNRQPDAVIFTGDTVQVGQADEYERLRVLLGPLKPPLYLVPGNRDDQHILRGVFKGCAQLFESPEFCHYVVDEHEVRLIGLDSTLSGERKGVFCRKRQAWLDATLSARPSCPTLLFIHHPPFDVDDHYVNGYRRHDEATALANIVMRHQQVRGLVCGHVHWPVDCWWADRPARITPSVAIDLRKGVDEKEATNRPIYMIHNLSRGEGIASQMILVST